MEAMFPKEKLYGSAGHKLTRSLFIETAQTDDVPFLSLRTQKDNGMISLRDLFITFCTEDPTEVIFAETVFGEVAFWEHLKKARWMDEWYTEWKFVADVKRKSLAFQSIIGEIKSGGRSAFTAAKYLIEEPWVDKRNKKVADKVKATTKQAADIVSSDIARLKDFQNNG